MAPRMPGPAILTNRLRSELIDLRKAAGMQHKDVMNELDWPASRIHRIEHGPSRVQTSDVMLLLQIYKVDNADERDRLIKLVQDSRLPGISTRYKNVLDPTFVEYLDYEAFADHIFSYQTKFIPGVLQQGGYADVVSGLRSSSVEQTERRSDARNERAQLLLAADGPSLEYIIDEAALHRAIGSTDQPWVSKYSVMKRVLRNLRELNTSAMPKGQVPASLNPRVSIRIVPLEWDLYDAYVGPFVILDFDNAKDPSVLFLEYPTSQQLILDDEEEIKKRRAEFQRLKESIPPASKTSEILTFIEKEYDSRLTRSPLRPKPSKDAATDEIESAD